MKYCWGPNSSAKEELPGHINSLKKMNFHVETVHLWTSMFFFLNISSFFFITLWPERILWRLEIKQRHTVPAQGRPVRRCCRSHLSRQLWGNAANPLHMFPGALGRGTRQREVESGSFPSCESRSPILFLLSDSGLSAHGQLYAGTSFGLRANGSANQAGMCTAVEEGCLSSLFLFFF